MNTSNRLVLTLPSEWEVLLTRVFNAPRQLVWDVITDPKHVMKWWGPRASTLRVCEMDFRPGGKWRFVLRGPDGRDYSFNGIYHEIQAPERLVATERFDEPSLGCPEWRATLTLEERNGKTTLQSRLVYPSREARDGHLASGMEHGAAESFERLEEQASSLDAGRR